MFGQNISERKKTASAVAATGLFLLFAILYFLPVSIPFKISFPLGILAVFSLWLLPWPMSFAMFASALGDLAGAAGNFIVQIEFFSVAHLFMTIFFVRRAFFRNRGEEGVFLRGKGRILANRAARLVITAVPVVILLVFALAGIVPEAPQGVIRVGVTSYAFIISIMLYSALLQHSRLYGAGALLFVLSDMILAWNKFVEPLVYERYLIMVPYYLGQLLLFLRAARLKNIYNIFYR